MTNGLIFLLVGPSGCGKSSIINHLLEEIPNLQRYTTYTTRSLRNGEVNGREYFFVSKDKFRKLITANKFVEWQEFYGNLYGSTKELMEKFLQGDIDGIAAYDVLGAKELMDAYPANVVTIFIVPPSIKVLRNRLIERYGQDSQSVGKLRLQRFDMEMQHARKFKYIVVNNDLEVSVNEVKSIFVAERCARRARESRR